jgi:hypothetical protein
MDRPARHAGVLLARVWLEGERGELFRARMRFIDDVTADQHVVTVARREEFLEVVEAWLTRFLEQARHGARSDPDPPTAPAPPGPRGAPESN